MPQKNDTQEKGEKVQIMGWGNKDNIGNRSIDSERLQMGYMNVIETPSFLPDGIMKLVMIDNNSAMPCNVRNYFDILIYSFHGSQKY